MTAIILAAGYATRLYPLTKDKPKPLLPVAGKPLLNYITEQIEQIDDINVIYVVTNHKFAHSFDNWAKGYACKKRIVIVDDGTVSEETRLGAIGDIYFTLESMKIDDELMIIAGDNLFTFSLPRYYEFFRQKNADTVCAKRVNDPEYIKQLAVAVTDESGKITELVEKPQNPPSNLGVYATYMYTRETAALFKTYLDEGNKPDAPGNFVAWLYKRKSVYVYEMDGECYDIGTHELYEEVNRRYLKS